MGKLLKNARQRWEQITTIVESPDGPTEVTDRAQCVYTVLSEGLVLSYQELAPFTPPVGMPVLPGGQQMRVMARVQVDNSHWIRIMLYGVEEAAALIHQFPAIVLSADMTVKRPYNGPISKLSALLEPLDGGGRRRSLNTTSLLPGGFSRDDGNGYRFKELLSANPKAATVVGQTGQVDALSAAIDRVGGVIGTAVAPPASASAPSGSVPPYPAASGFDEISAKLDELAADSTAQQASNTETMEAGQ